MEKNDIKLQQYFVIVLALGLLLRLILMPFFSHVDLFSEYRRVFFALQTESYFPSAHRVVVFYIEMFFARLFAPFINNPEVIFYLPDPTHSTAQLTDYFFFVNNPHIFRHLFLLKLPYLFFDVATAVVIWRYLENSAHKKLGLLIWLFNPIMLYAVYIFGRFESIGLFFLAVTALNIKRQRYALASLCFGAAMHSREIIIILAPVLVLSLVYFKQSLMQNVRVVGLSLAGVVMVYMLPGMLLDYIGGVSVFADTGSVTSMNNANQIYKMGHQWFYPIVFGLGALAFYLWETADRKPEERFVVGSAVCLCLFFMFSGHSAHYSSWLILFPILSVQYGRKVVLPFLYLFFVWFVYWLFRTDIGTFTSFLASPMSVDFSLMEPLPKLYDRLVHNSLFPLSKVVEILRTLFALSMAFFIWRLLKPDSKVVGL